MSESHRETRVLEYPFSTPFLHTKGYSRVLSGGLDGPRKPAGLSPYLLGVPGLSLKMKLWFAAGDVSNEPCEHRFGAKTYDMLHKSAFASCCG